jgi:hypothetical protein
MMKDIGGLSKERSGGGADNGKPGKPFFQGLAPGQLQNNDMKLASYYIAVKFQIEIFKRARSSVIGFKNDLTIEMLLDSQKKKLEGLMEKLRESLSIVGRITKKIDKLEKGLDVLETRMKWMINTQMELIDRSGEILRENGLDPNEKSLVNHLDSQAGQKIRAGTDRQKSQVLNQAIHKIIVQEVKSEEDSSDHGGSSDNHSENRPSPLNPSTFRPDEMFALDQGKEQSLFFSFN